MQKSPQVSILSPFPLYKQKGVGYPRNHTLSSDSPTANEINDLLTASQNPKAAWSLEGRGCPLGGYIAPGQ